MPITEQTPTVPVNPYGAAKLAAEVRVLSTQLARSASTAIPISAY